MLNACAEELEKRGGEHQPCSSKAAKEINPEGAGGFIPRKRLQIGAAFRPGALHAARKAQSINGATQLCNRA